MIRPIWCHVVASLKPAPGHCRVDIRIDHCAAARSVGLSALARRIKVPYPTFPAIGGALIAFVPSSPSWTHPDSDRDQSERRHQQRRTARRSLHRRAIKAARRMIFDLRATAMIGTIRFIEEELDRAELSAGG